MMTTDPKVLINEWLSNSMRRPIEKYIDGGSYENVLRQAYATFSSLPTAAYFSAAKESWRV